jgi:hypothetical protein
MILRRRRSSTKRRSGKFVIRMGRACFSGNRKRGMQASKLSTKHSTGAAVFAAVVGSDAGRELARHGSARRNAARRALSHIHILFWQLTASRKTRLFTRPARRRVVESKDTRGRSLLRKPRPGSPAGRRYQQRQRRQRFYRCFLSPRY